MWKVTEKTHLWCHGRIPWCMCSPGPLSQKGRDRTRKVTGRGEGLARAVELVLCREWQSLG